MVTHTHTLITTNIFFVIFKYKDKSFALLARPVSLTRTDIDLKYPAVREIKKSQVNSLKGLTNEHTAKYTHTSLDILIAVHNFANFPWL